MFSRIGNVWVRFSYSGELCVDLIYSFSSFLSSILCCEYGEQLFWLLGVMPYYWKNFMRSIGWGRTIYFHRNILLSKKLKDNLWFLNLHCVKTTNYAPHVRLMMLFPEECWSFMTLSSTQQNVVVPIANARQKWSGAKWPFSRFDGKLPGKACFDLQNCIWLSMVISYLLQACWDSGKNVSMEASSSFMNFKLATAVPHSDAIFCSRWGRMQNYLFIS